MPNGVSFSPVSSTSPTITFHMLDVLRDNLAPTLAHSASGRVVLEPPVRQTLVWPLYDRAGTTTEERHPRETIQSLRSRELEWISRHMQTLRQFQGEWVVIEGSSIISHSPDMIQAVEEARIKGIAIPFLYRVSREDELPFIGCGRLWNA